MRLHPGHAFLAAAVWLAVPVPLAGQSSGAPPEGSAAGTAGPPPAPGGQRPITLVDLNSIPSLSDPRPSPDGRRLLFVLSEADWENNRTVDHIWRARMDGSDLRRLTAGERGGSEPRWSPDGAWIAFLSDRDDGTGDEERRTRVWVMRSDGGEARPLTAHETSVSAPQWSRDGRWIYFLAEEEKPAERKAREEAKNDVYAFDEDWLHVHLWRVDATGLEASPLPDAAPVRAAERVTRGDFTVDAYALSAEGDRIVHHRVPGRLFDDQAEGEVWLMAADGTAARRLTRNRVPETGARLSPDGRSVLYRCFCSGGGEFYFNDKLFVVPAAGGDPRLLLPDLPHQVDDAAWSADGRSIYFLANTGVRRDLFRVDVEGENLSRLTEGDHALGHWRYEPDLGLHVFAVDRPDNPGDVWALEEGTPGAEPRRVTRVFDDLSARFRLPRQEAVRWPGEDGVEVEGILYWPLDYRAGERHPLVVQTHGGPPASDKFGFGSARNYAQVLTALGYFVLQPNYRGSTGYGDDFLRDMVPGYFNQSHRDVMAGVDHLIERGLVDGERMAKMGWSAGGHMTNQIITWTDRFRAASSGAGAVNWISMYGLSDVRIYRTPWFGGTPWEEGAPIEVYWEHSPLSRIHRVRTPTIVLVGENDVRVPMAQSVELYRALRANGVPTHLYVAPRAGHGWRELRHRLFKANVELEWFERWVRDREYRWERAPGDPEEAGIDASARLRARRGGEEGG